MTQEQKQALLADYNNRENKVHDIADKYGLHTSRIVDIVIEHGGTPRRPNALGKRGGDKTKICPKCRKRIEIMGAKFCCYCGSDMRSNKEILKQKL